MRYKTTASLITGYPSWVPEGFFLRIAAAIVSGEAPIEILGIK